MKVTNQLSSNDCGVCVLASIYEHLYSEQINEQTILKDFKLPKDGMSVYDFEILAKEINIETEVYKASFNELVKTNYKDYFVTLFKSEKGNHFVICKFKSKYVEVFDSIQGVIKLEYQKFEKIYNNVFIIFYKTFTKKVVEKHHSIIKQIKFFDLPNESFLCFLLILIDTLILVVSLVGSSIIKLAINFVSDNITQNLFFIGLYFIFINLFQALLQYLFSLIKTKKLDIFSKRNFIFYINYLNNKNALFFRESKRKELYQYPIAISKVLYTKYIAKPQIISDSIFFVCLLLMMGYLSFYYMLFAIGYSLISVVLSYFLKKYNEKNYENNNFIKNESDYYFNLLYEFLYKEKNNEKLNYLNEKCKSLFWLFSKQNMMYSSYLFQNNFLNFSLKKIAFVIFVIISMFWIVSDSNQNIDIAKMLFAITLLNLFDNTCTSIFGFVSEFANYKKSKQLLEKFLENDNKSYRDCQKININRIESIKINNLNFEYDVDNKIFKNYQNKFNNKTIIFGKNGIGKSTLLKILGLHLQITNSEILINDIDLNSINVKKMEEKICYIPSDATPMDVDYSTIMELNPSLITNISDFLKVTKLSTKRIDEMSKGEAQLSNLFSLLKLKDSLILLDECFSNISNKNIELFMNSFFDSICQNNFVLCVSHSKNIRKYFEYESEIK